MKSLIRSSLHAAEVFLPMLVLCVALSMQLISGSPSKPVTPEKATEIHEPGSRLLAKLDKEEKDSRLPFEQLMR